MVVLRIFAFDIGDRKIGIAVSDEFGWTAQGLETYYRSSLEKDCLYIKHIIDQYLPEKIIVGLPKNMNGTIGSQALKVKEFINKLSEYSIPEVIYWDERLTTVTAEKTLIAGNMSREKRKKKIDMLAAVLILQNYLDFIMINR